MWGITKTWGITPAAATGNGKYQGRQYEQSALVSHRVLGNFGFGSSTLHWVYGAMHSFHNDYDGKPSQKVYPQAEKNIQPGRWFAFSSFASILA
ncbi:MAG: hypothetical protein KFF50_06890 [Desulfatitalea sp.]|nr:hypothetical protein [Desulfatitalea sp.]